MLEIFDALLDRLLALEAAMLWGGVISWVFFACLLGALGSSRGRSGIGFFLLSLLLSPMGALLVLYFLPDLRRQRLLALESRIAELERRAGLPATADPSLPATQEASQSFMDDGNIGPGVPIAVLIVLLLLLAIIGGVSQLGKSANTTFTTISDSM